MRRLKLLTKNLDDYKDYKGRLLGVIEKTDNSTWGARTAYAKKRKRKLESVQIIQPDLMIVEKK